jgi:hypothetical protein
MHDRGLSSLAATALCALVLVSGCKSDAEKCARDPAGNLALCEGTCESGTIASCVAAAHVYDERFEAGGADAKLSAERAINYYEKACKGGESEACWAAIRGVLRGPTERDPDIVMGEPVPDAGRRRRVLLETGCTLGSLELCREVADALLGHEDDKAASYAGRCCEMEFDDDARRAACVSERAKLAKRAYDAARGCEQGKPGACRVLGSAVAKSDHPRAREAFDKECRRRRLLEGGSTKACVDTSMKAALTPELPEALALPTPPADAAAPSAVVMLSDVSLVPDRPSSPSPEAIRAELDRGTSELATCYRTARTDNPNLEGKLTLQFTIDGVGDTWDVHATKVELKDMRMVRCVVERAGVWRFPAPARETVAVQTTFTFRK